MAEAAQPSIEDLVCQLLETPPTLRLARMAEMCTQFPARAPGLRDRYEWLAANGLLSASAAAAALDPPDIPQHLGQYTVHGVLGRGGMGIVYLGSQPSLGDRAVAIKVVRPELLVDPRAAARFVREAMLAARLDHGNLCAVLDVGQQDGTPFLVMPRIEGELLSARIAHWRREPAARPPWQAIVAMIEKLARGLHHAHERGLVHRDVKSGNVMLRSDGEPVLLDFGLARDLREAPHDLTLTHDLIGTPAFMAPEQADRRGRNADARTDVYALAVTAFEAIALALPHAAASRADLLQAIATEPATPLRRLAPDVPRDLESVLATALATEPAHRYSDAAAFADDLGRVLRREPILARRPGPFARCARWTARNRMASALIATLAAGLGTYAVLVEQLRASERTATVTAKIADSRRLAGSRRNGEAAELALAAREVERSPRTLAVVHEAMANLRDRVVLRGRPLEKKRYFVSPDGRHLAVHGDASTLCVYRVDAAAAPLLQVDDASYNSAWFANDVLLVTHDDATVSRQGLDGSVAWRTAPLGKGVFSIAVYLDRIAVGCGERRVVLLDAATGTVQSSLQVESEPDPKSAIDKVAFAPNGGSLLLVSERRHPTDERLGGLHLVPCNGAPGRQIEPIRSNITRLAVASTGFGVLLATPRLVVFRTDGEVAARFGVGKGIEEAHRFPVHCMRLAPDGRSVAFGSESTWRAFDFDRLELSPPAAQPVRVNNLEFTADGLAVLTAGADGLVRWFDRTSRMQVEELLRCSGEASTLQRLDAETFVIDDSLSDIEYVLQTAGDIWGRRRLAVGQVQLHVGWAADGTLVTSARGSTGMLARWTAGGGQHWCQEAGKAALRTQPDGRTGIVRWLKDGVLQTIDAENGAPIASGPGVTPQGREYELRALDTASGGRRAVLVWQNPGRVASEVAAFEFDGAAWCRTATRTDAQDVVDHVAALADGRYLLSGKYGRLWLADADLTSSTLLFEHRTGLGFAAVSPSNALVTAHDGAVLWVDLASGAVSMLGGNGPTGTAAAISADGRHAAVGDAAGEVALWTLPERTLVVRFQAHAADIDRLAFSPDGTLLASGSGDGTCVIWPVEPDHADALARQRLQDRSGLAPPR